jgi:orotidine-5'-phosphate decarboxylase
MTAREAIEAGASYIVVGRPIVETPGPRDAARRIVAEMDGR